MQLFFIDESGTPPPPQKTTTDFFVVGGVIISENQWHQIEHDLNYLKSQFNVQGELKWRHFGQREGRETDSNNLTHLNRIHRDELRSLIFDIINKYHSIKLITTVTDIRVAYEQPFIHSEQDLYWYTYKPLTERFQYYLQDLSRQLGSKINGLIVCDHREKKHDDSLRRLHANLLSSGSRYGSRYENLIEGLFIAPSHLSIGIQLADMIVGAVFRKLEHEDNRWFSMLDSSWRKSPDGKIEGYGLIKFPKKGAERKMTLSQSEAPILQY